MTTTKQLAGQEWKAHWGLVLACSFGWSLSTLVSHSIGLFMGPIGDELGWSRAQISSGMIIIALSTIVLSPLGGAMVDRWGSRRLAIPGITLTAMVIASYGIVQSVPMWLGLWSLYALVSIGVKLTVWTSAASNAFTAGRGLAVAATISGTAFTGVFAPPIANWLIDSFGWRHAYMLLAAGWGSIALLLAIVFLFEPYDP
ncbi:MAG: MFS transporter, partial [Sphingomonadales bacterium]